MKIKNVTLTVTKNFLGKALDILNSNLDKKEILVDKDIHIRPAAKITEIASQYDLIYITKNGKRVNAINTLDILALSIKKDDLITVESLPEIIKDVEKIIKEG